jgi:2-haloacid dehalogenase
LKLRDFEALTFDCYGTLIDWERGLLAELRPWTERHGLKLGDDDLLAAFAEVEPAEQARTPDKAYPDILAAVYRRHAERWRISVNQNAARAFGQSVGRWPAFPDTAGSLQYLKRHYKLVILSNVDRASFAESNKKLGVTFDRIITAQDVGSYKPDARNFAYAIETLAGMGVAKEKILHTAQSLFHDIVPAKAAGLSTVWVNRRKGHQGGGATPTPAIEVRPDLEVADLAELVDLHRNERSGE